MSSSARRLLVLCMALLLWALPGGDAFAQDRADAQAAIPQGEEDYFFALFGFTDIPVLDAKTIRIQIAKSSLSAEVPIKNTAAAVSIALSHPATCEKPELPHFCVTIGGEDHLPAPYTRASLIASLTAKDTKSIWVEAKQKETKGPQQVNLEDETTQRLMTAPRLGAVKIFQFGLLVAAYLAVFILAPVWWGRKAIRRPRKEAIPVLGWFAAALLLRFVLIDAVQISHDAAQLHPQWLLNFPSKGLAMPVLRWVLEAVFGHSDVPVFAFGRLAGAATVALGYVLMRQLKAGPFAANLAAFLLAITPIMLRFSASDSVHSVMAAFYLGALVAWIVACEYGNGRAAIVTAALLILVIQTRPEGMVLAPTVLLFTRRPLKIPGYWWVLALPVGLVAIFTGWIAVVDEALGTMIEGVVYQRDFTLYDYVYQTFFQPLGTGVGMNEPQLAVYWRDALLGSLPQWFSGQPEFRPHYMIQWVSPLLVPFVWLGMLIALFKPRFWPVFAAMILIRLPRWWVLKMSPIVAYELFEVRYFIGTLLMQFLLAALALATIYALFKKWRATRWLAYGLGGLLLINLAVAAPRPLNFRYSFQEEYAFIRAEFAKLPANSRVFLYDPYANDLSNLDVSLHVMSSIVLFNRPDVQVSELGKVVNDWLPSEPHYYLRLGSCAIEPDWLYDRGIYVPPSESRPYSPWGSRDKSVSEDEIINPLDDVMLVNIARFHAVCGQVDETIPMTPVARQMTNIQDFAVSTSIFPNMAELGLYRLPDDLDPARLLPAALLETIRNGTPEPATPQKD